MMSTAERTELRRRETRLHFLSLAIQAGAGPSEAPSVAERYFSFVQGDQKPSPGEDTAVAHAEAIETYNSAIRLKDELLERCRAWFDRNEGNPSIGPASLVLESLEFGRRARLMLCNDRYAAVSDVRSKASDEELEMALETLVARFKQIATVFVSSHAARDALFARIRDSRWPTDPDIVGLGGELNT